MTISYLEYELQNGFIHNWLVAGPQVIPLQAPQSIPEQEYRADAAQKLYEPGSGVQKTPVERGPLTEGIFQLGDFETTWEYTACDEDHLIQRSAACPGWNYLRAWAYTYLRSQGEQQVALTVTAFGPVDLWLNGKPVFHSELLAGKVPQPQTVNASLREGKNELVARFANVAETRCPLALAVQLGPSEKAISVRIPTAVKSASRRREIEDIMRTAYTEKDVFGYNEVVRMAWPKENPRNSFITVRLQTPPGHIYTETEAEGAPGEILGGITASQLVDGHYHFLQMPRSWEVYESNIRIFHPLDVWVTASYPYSPEPEGEIPDRLGKLLQYALRFENNLYTEIARMISSDWDNVDLKVVLNNIDSIQKGEESSVLALTTIFNLLAYFTEDRELPAAIREPLEPALREAVLAYHFAPSVDARMDFASESREILFHACETIAGQRYPDEVFADGRPGQDHRALGEASALAWMRARGQAGFSTWESPAVYAETLVALSLLINAAESEPIWEMASVLVDKVLFSLSINTFQGTFACAHRRASHTAQRSGLMEETAGIGYLLWGTGVFNPHLAAPINLAMMKNYELVPIFEQIAAAYIPMLSREGLVGKDGEASMISYRTGDYMLSSVQDYRKGQVGDQEQVWRATLGPNAVVFTNHPAASQDGGSQPGFWAGNRSLPTVAQWKDVLIAIYNLPVEPPPAGGLGFTHAYFPTTAFDEYIIRDNWAFARKGKGYLALTASNPMTLTTTGPHAYRELRVGGSEVVWVCHMGSRMTDGEFAAFQERILAMPVSFSSLAASLTSLRNEELAFAWDGGFTALGAPFKISGFPQYESRYCTAPQPSDTFDIHSEDYILRLNFEG